MAWTIEGKHVLITGGNSGIGRATAEQLALLGARVTITARDPSKGQVVADEIRRSAGADVEVRALDLSQLQSVWTFAAGYLDDHERLDVLINNAGVMAGSRRMTPDGFEWTFAVNHLGPFLLTNLVTDLLLRSAPARIINVSSELHQRVSDGLNFDDLQMTRGYSPSKAYAASKFANIVFTVELDRRLREAGVIANAVHPGVVATSIGKGPEGPKWMRLLATVAKPVLRKPAHGAATSVFLATREPQTLESERYWSDCRPKQALPASLDAAASARLWALSEQMVGITNKS